VPPIEACVPFLLVFFGYVGLVEGGVGWVLELSLGKAFVVVDCAVTDKLDLGLARDGLEIRMEDRLRF
jgi:hypothetical protein